MLIGLGHAATFDLFHIQKLINYPGRVLQICCKMYPKSWVKNF